MAAGRKLQFDKDQALDEAMQVFWANGYSGTSLNQLTSALGINKPSLYAAFGNKEQLYCRALERYGSRYGEPRLQHLTKPDTSPLREGVQAYLLAVARFQTDPDLPGGCFFVQTTGEARASAMPHPVVDSMTTINRQTLEKLTGFFEREKAAGRLDSESAPGTLALYLMNTLFGMAMIARNGATFSDLEKVVALAIQVF
ncbi:MAG: TetR/AcrR family transcriptional regulator [Pseudomonadota bacterium]|nr:TetR/AcrR family transcriptional regulator [Pseudomonadota bacterium]